MPTASRERDPAKDSDWVDLAVHWRFGPDTIYLNHGSFGLPPDEVRYARRGFINRLDENPMDFFLRQMEGLLLAARVRFPTSSARGQTIWSWWTTRPTA